MNSELPLTPSWEPFKLSPRGSRAQEVRALNTPEGIADRLRIVAFAEMQARQAFLWAAESFEEATPELRDAWRRLAKEEEKHFGWLMNRLMELDVNVGERLVCDDLWHSLVGCTSSKEFAVYMATAEERGRKGGERFYQSMLNIDPISAKLFGKIAEEEVMHIRLAAQFFPEDTTDISERARTSIYPRA